jgi:hypothetical protein
LQRGQGGNLEVEAEAMSEGFVVRGGGGGAGAGGVDGDGEEVEVAK